MNRVQSLELKAKVKIKAKVYIVRLKVQRVRGEE
jgi:hypothetical protein